MSEQDNIRIVQEALEAWNKHDPARFVALLDEKHVIESDTIPAPMAGREVGRQSSGPSLRNCEEDGLRLTQHFGGATAKMPK